MEFQFWKMKNYWRLEAEGMVEAVERLPSKDKVLSSNHSVTKQKSSEDGWS
jgi:hypothetical protein